MSGISLDVPEYGLSIEEILNPRDAVLNVGDLKKHYISIISIFQKELAKAKRRVTDIAQLFGSQDDSSGVPTSLSITDPTINYEILHLKKELCKAKTELDEARAKLSDTYPKEQSVSKLKQKIRDLQDENDSLHRQLHESQVQPMSMEFVREKERNRVLESHIKTLYNLNVELDRDNEHLTKKMAIIVAEHTEIKRDRDHLSKKVERMKEVPGSSTKQTETSKSRKRDSSVQKSPPKHRRGSQSLKRSPSFRRRERSVNRSPHTRNADRYSRKDAGGDSARNNSRDRSRNKSPRRRRF